MMQVFDGNSRKIIPANANDQTQIAEKDQLERTKSSLRDVRTMHQIKAVSLGQCYQSLGDIIWQILCDIYLHNIDEINFSVSDLARSLELPETFAKRSVIILESEALVQTMSVEECFDSQDLLLTELGRSKVEMILSECTDVFAETLNYSRLKLVKVDD